jgi:CRISPR type III-A-associated protein Csm2
MMTRHPQGSRGQQRPPATPVPIFFDLEKTDTELFDTLAEKQAEQLEINSSQLRRFFGELKDLYRQWRSVVANRSDEEREGIYRARFEPRFKMIRSKVSYATRSGGQANLDRRFADFLMQCIAKVSSSRDFERFITFFEAVVGFMYGKGKVKDRR